MARSRGLGDVYKRQGFSTDAPKLWSELLGKGVLIRDVGLPGYLRVTVGNEAENTLFISALKELI
jgi:histidinol-phosphate aminotransferase